VRSIELRISLEFECTWQGRRKRREEEEVGVESGKLRRKKRHEVKREMK